MVNETNSGPERLFSRVTKLTRGRRSQLGCLNVDAMVRIQELGPKVNEVDVELRKHDYTSLERNKLYNSPPVECTILFECKYWGFVIYRWLRDLPSYERQEVSELSRVNITKES